MRTLIALTIVLCVAGAAYLLPGPAFFWPERTDPSHGILLQGTASSLLGAGLLATAAAGVVVIRRAGSGSHRPASPRWQTRYFLLLAAALGLVGAAFSLGERTANPDSASQQTPPAHARAEAASEAGARIR